jgi:transcriptional regulator with XRE-family HTH domain
MPTKVLNPIDIYVGSRVRMRRLMLRMSQGALADQLGLTFQQVQKYEKGTNRISASRLHELGHILQVPVPFFFDGVPQTKRQTRRDDEVSSPAYVPKFLASADGHALMRPFARINDSAVLRSVVRLVEAIVGGEGL